MEANELHLAAYRRYLRTKNRSPVTIDGYEFTITQLAKAHIGRDVMTLTRSDLEHYLVSMLETQEASSVGHHFRNMRAFYNWALAEEMIDSSPLRGLEAPKITDKPPPIVPDEDIRALLKVCNGRGFDARRDAAVIRVLCEPGSPRASELARMTVDDLDMRHDQITIRGKGDKIRTVPFGAKTGQALDRYLRARAQHPKASLPALWLGARGMGMTRSGFQQMLRRRARQAGIEHIYPHLLRHTSANAWADSGGSDQNAMQLFGWSSPEMPRVYGRAAGAERARRAARRASLGDRF